jgi:hypothetical protein
MRNDGLSERTFDITDWKRNSSNYCVLDQTRIAGKTNGQLLKPITATLGDIETGMRLDIDVRVIARRKANRDSAIKDVHVVNNVNTVTSRHVTSPNQKQQLQSVGQRVHKLLATAR